MAEKPTEHIEYINDSLHLLVSRAHTFGTDALLLAAFSAPKRNAKVCDFGTGCGIIPFYWLRSGVKNVYAVEIQPDACEMLTRSIKMNSLEDNFTLVNSDLRKPSPELPAGTFDNVTMNPPYTSMGHGIMSETQTDKIARHETELTLPQLCSAAARLLKFGGSFSICLRPERLCEAMTEFHNAKLEPKRLRLVAQRDGSKPWLFLLEGKKGRNSGLIIEPELKIEAPDGGTSQEMLDIIGSYKKS